MVHRPDDRADWKDHIPNLELGSTRRTMMMQPSDFQRRWSLTNMESCQGAWNHASSASTSEEDGAQMLRNSLMTS
ncbi:hypothetical protein B9Z55_017613 [Caenorhabditis nigoni]|uniref:Uncharacterized protein n=1 Tax=Caenorhabditis nigoni TaxID=1611254 RepID=A0A2G5TAI2_9PELO|nr:hypothetical protein B9Z55_017613 [Caenorhabditis nigoni]